MVTRARTFMATLESYNRLNPPAPKPVATLEGIAFQNNDSFGPEMEALVEQAAALIEAKAVVRGKSIPADLEKKFEALIFKRLGIKVELTTNDSLAATMPNVFIPHNSVIREDIRWIYEMYEEVGAQKATRKLKDLTVMGKIDTSTAKVSGWFSEQVAPLFVNFYELVKTFKMSPAEITAIILHELGHDWSAIELSSNINQTNRIIADVAKNITTDGRGDVEVIYRDLKKIYPDIGRDIAEGLTSGNQVVMSVALFRLVVGATQTLMFEGTYDKTTFEALADQFPARFGYGPALVSGLEKLEDNFTEFDYHKYVYGEAVQLFLQAAAVFVVCIVAVALAGIIALPFTALAGLTSFLIMKTMVGTQRATQKDMTYDNIRDRYLRIRSQIVERIKNKNLSAAIRRTLIEQIDMIDEVVKHKQVFISWVEKFTNNWIPSDRRAFMNLQAQQDIEKMIANDIFISANRLSLKA